ncbi:MAG TPA: DUF1638 domain-containing protein [Dehalococcoidales bacterium]
MLSKLLQFSPERCLVISCATVFEEIQPLMPAGMRSSVLEFGLHVDPIKLRQRLQLTIDSLPADVEYVLLGYGLCSQAVTGLKSDTRTLVVPRVDDCIALFLGSVAEYEFQHKSQPGTLYLTKGWIEAGGSPLENQNDMVKRYGEKKAKALLAQMLKNYTRLVFINTGNYELERYRQSSRDTAAELNLRYEEIKGSNNILRKLLYGPWDGQFVVAKPGKTIVFADFRGSEVPSHPEIVQRPSEEKEIRPPPG